MLHVENTENYAGVTISGDNYDFEELYEALHSIVGEEEDHPAYEGARIRVLAVCYDLRHALMGTRTAVNKPNGLDRERMRHLGFVGSDHNVYYQFEVLWPELLFVSFALNDFIEIHERSKTVHAWNAESAAVRKFQAAVGQCLQETLTEKKFANIKKYFSYSAYNNFAHYATQYIDKLNIDFIKMDKEKRFNHISIMAKRIAVRDQNYLNAQAQIREVAAEMGVSQLNIRFGEDYPDEIDW